MALTIKKRNSNKTIKIPGFDLEKLVTQSISSLIVGELGLRNDRLIRYVEYFPAYTICEVTKDKSIGSFFLRTRFDPTYKRIAIKHIELSGATIIEFIDFLEERGAVMNPSPMHQLETI